MFRNILIALSVIGCLTAPTVAAACISRSPEVRRMQAHEQAERGIREIDKRLPSATLSDADLAKVKGLRARAGTSLAAGKSDAAMNRIAEILKILGVPYGDVFALPAKCG